MPNVTTTKVTQYVIARDQWYIADNGDQFVRGYDEASVVGRGRTLAAAVRRAGGWAFMSGYRAYDGRTGECLGRVDQFEDGRYTTQPDF